MFDLAGYAMENIENSFKTIKKLIYNFQLMGLSILTVGVWAWSEKDIFNNLGKVANVALDPAFILICVGEFVIIYRL